MNEMNEFNEQNNNVIPNEQTAAPTDETNNTPEEIKPNIYTANNTPKETVYLSEGVSTNEFRSEFGIPTDTPKAEPVTHGSMDSSNTRVYSDARYSTSNYQYQTYDTYDTNENYRTTTDTKLPVYSKDFTKKETKEKSRRRGSVVWVALLCILLSLLSGFAGAWAYNKYVAKPETSVIYESVAPETTSVVSDTTSLADVIEKLKPSVVEVRTEVVTYGHFFGQSISQGAGSGVFLTDDGYIVTNFHVIKNSNSVTVTTTDGKEYPAEVIGYDEEEDLAVIKIEGTGFSPAVIGDSAAARVGDTAIAIGNPLGTLGGTVTTGIVSALDRQIEVEGQMMNLLQTNAAVSPGNSGGGLFNAKGELIGIVNAKSDGEDVEGLGFAIPSNTVKEVTADIMENKTTSRVSTGPILGVTVVSVNNDETAKQYNVSRYGIYIVAVSPGYGSEKAGLEVGDYIISVDGTAVFVADDISEVLNNHKVGDVVEVQVIRDNQVKTFKVELLEYTH
ncbi:MAG: trypsin-like peptidase domain-containing protein [Oscillospiraceae bacterium]|nr:trypsin-like peptidase domain-containing protein [Oscillospiraceae bacterium]MBR0451019.1 trypsin-like peptidase domain-containing protein [Oscillospiraceae bacterium]